MTVTVNPPETDLEELSTREDRFAQLYYAAKDDRLRGNATLCYAQAYWDERPEPGSQRYRTATSAGSRLLRRDRVCARIREIRDAAEERAKQTAASFWEDVPQARETLRWALTGEWPHDFEGDDQAKRSAIEAAKTVIERAYGSVKIQHEHSLDGQAIVAHVAGAPQEAPDRRDDSEGSDNDRELPSPGPKIKPVED